MLRSQYKPLLMLRRLRSKLSPKRMPLKIAQTKAQTKPLLMLRPQTKPLLILRRLRSMLRPQ